MTRRLLLGLQQALCRSLATYQPASQLLPVAACSPCTVLPSLGNSSVCQSFATATAHPQQSPAADSLQQSLPEELDTAVSDVQQAVIPADQYSFLARTTKSYSVRRKLVFAVVELGPTQFKVTPDDIVYSERLKGVDVGDKVSLNRVLLLGNRETTVIGRPLVPDAYVTAIVEVEFGLQAWCRTFGCHRDLTGMVRTLPRCVMQEQFLNGKVLIFKKRRRKNSRRMNGHRQVSSLKESQWACVFGES